MRYIKRPAAAVIAALLSLSLVFCGCSSSGSKTEAPEAAEVRMVGNTDVSKIFTDTGAEDRNGFDEKLTMEYKFGGFTYKLPDYYSLIEGSENSFSSKDSKGESAISFNYFLKGEQVLDEESMKTVIPNLMKFADLKISDIGSTEVCGHKAYFGKVTFSDSLGRASVGVVILIDNTEQSVYDMAMFFQTSEAEFSYGKDYLKIVQAMTPDKDFKPSESTDSADAASSNA